MFAMVSAPSGRSTRAISSRAAGLSSKWWNAKVEIT